MTSVPQPNEFDEIESLSQAGTFWSPRDPEKQHPAKLVLRCTGWTTVKSKYTDAERPVLIGETRDDEAWKVPCDNLDLLPLHTGDVREWNADKGIYEVVDNWGPVRVGEIVAIEYRGDREYVNKVGQKVATGSFRTTRKPAPADDDSVDATIDQVLDDLDREAGLVAADDDIPL